LQSLNRVKNTLENPQNVGKLSRSIIRFLFSFFHSFFYQTMVGWMNEKFEREAKGKRRKKKGFPSQGKHSLNFKLSLVFVGAVCACLLRYA
jgi:uncharacterized Tic20 family protein